MKWVKKVFLWLLMIVSVLAAAGAVVSLTMKDKIVNFLTQEINKHLVTKIKVESVDFTIWKQFPMAALELNGVAAYDDNQKNPLSDTLFQFEKVFLAFNAQDIYNQNYTVRSVKLVNGSAALYTDKKGKANYIFWKENQADTSTTSFAIELEKITLDNVHVDWYHQNRKENIKVYAPHVVAKGEFSNKQNNTALYGEILVKKMQFDNTDYLPNEKVKVDVGFEVGEDNNFQISRGLLSLRNKYDFDVKGKFNKDDYQMTIEGKNLNINAIKELVPKSKIEALNDYDGKGNLDFICTIEKPKKSTRQKITATFNVSNATVTHKKSGYTVNQLSLGGRYSNGTKMSLWTSELEINDAKAQLKSGQVEGNLKLFNFKRPRVNLDLKANYRVEDFLQFFPSDTIQSATGQVEFDAHFNGVIQNPDTIRPQDLIKAKVTGHMNLRDIDFKLKKDNLQYTDFNVDLDLKNNGVIVHEFLGKIADTDVDLKGKLINFLPWLFYDTETLRVDASLTSDWVNLNQLLSGQQSAENKEDYQLHFPKNIKSKIKFNINKFSLEKLEAQAISGQLISNANSLKFSNVRLKAINGEVKGDLLLQERKAGGFYISSAGNLSSIDIQQLFEIFNNFGQSSIESRHLKGIADSQYKLRANMKQDLHIDMKTLDITADLTVNNGELINYEPLQSVTQTFDENKILRLLIKLDDFKQRLKHIKFDKLQNTFTIKDETLLIPQMKITSSALNINLAGKHTFDNHIDYLLDFNLKEVLTRKEKIKTTEYGYVKDDGTGNKIVFLKITGTVDNPEISLNRKASSQHSKELIQRELSTAKQILKEEFNISGEANKRNEEEIKEAEFELELHEFDEQTAPDSSTINKALKDTTQKKGLKKLFDKMNKGQKEEKSKFEEWEFEEDDF